MTCSLEKWHIHLSVTRSLSTGHAVAVAIDKCEIGKRNTLLDMILQVFIFAKWEKIQIVIA